MMTGRVWMLISDAVGCGLREASTVPARCGATTSSDSGLPPRCGNPAFAGSPLIRGALGGRLSGAVFEQLAHRRDVLANLRHRVFELLLGATELLAPVLHLERVHGVDAA